MFTAKSGPCSYCPSHFVHLIDTNSLDVHLKPSSLFDKGLPFEVP